MEKLTEKQIICLKDLLEIIRSDDLLDLDSYDSIDRSNKISNAWEALKVLDLLLAPLAQSPRD